MNLALVFTARCDNKKSRARLYSLTGKPTSQSPGDYFVIDEPNIAAIKKTN